MALHAVHAGRAALGAHARMREWCQRSQYFTRNDQMYGSPSRPPLGVLSASGGGSKRQGHRQIGGGAEGARGRAAPVCLSRSGRLIAETEARRASGVRLTCSFFCSPSTAEQGDTRPAPRALTRPRKRLFQHDHRPLTVAVAKPLMFRYLPPMTSRLYCRRGPPSHCVAASRPATGGWGGTSDYSALGVHLEKS